MMSDRQAPNLSNVLRLEVPVIVRLASRSMPVGEVIRLTPGSIVELPRSADSELELFVNNRAIGFGRAVKVGEKFGLRLTYIGPVADRLTAMVSKGDGGKAGVIPDSPVAIADRLLSGR